MELKQNHYLQNNEISNIIISEIINFDKIKNYNNVIFLNYPIKISYKIKPYYKNILFKKKIIKLINNINDFVFHSENYEGELIVVLFHLFKYHDVIIFYTVGLSFEGLEFLLKIFEKIMKEYYPNKILYINLNKEFMEHINNIQNK